MRLGRALNQDVGAKNKSDPELTELAAVAKSIYPLISAKTLACVGLILTLDDHQYE